jgi:hypothetical protein
MFLFDRRNGSPQILADVPLGSSGGNGVAKDLAAVGQGPVGGFDDPSFLHPTQSGQKLGRRDLVYGALAKPGENIALQAALDFVGVARRPA